MPTWGARLTASVQKGGAWSKKRLTDGQAKVRAAVDRLSENPELPEGIRQQLRESRSEVFTLLKGVRSAKDIKALRGQLADVVAARITGIAEWTAEHPGDFHTLDDVERLCDSTVMWTAGIVDTVGFVAGAFAVGASAATLGISFGHFFVLCYAMGLLASLSDGTAELYAVTSWLTHQGHPDPAAEAIRLCAEPRHSKTTTHDTQTQLDHEPEPVEAGDLADQNAELAQAAIEDGQQPMSPARQLAWRWTKLSLAAGLPVFNDRYMGRESEALVRALAGRQFSGVAPDLGLATQTPQGRTQVAEIDQTGSTDTTTEVRG
jgi:hypothetical protein